MEKGTVVILGGDGFCGWPAALHLSYKGYQVVIVDNHSRRAIDRMLDIDSMVPIANMANRIRRWCDVTGRQIGYARISIDKEYQKLVSFLDQVQPDAVVHFAEQRAAPFSMKSPANKRYTVDNNVGATHNLLCALVELGLDAHVVHLGTMGVYGYGTAGMAIPEGYVDARLRDPISKEWVDTQIYYPANPGSVYHMTKVLDTQLFYYYNKNDKLRITDLHQGIIWGVATPHTQMHEELANRVDYDGDYGTVLNRFIVQAAKGHPLTVFGTGGQTRAFIHLEDMCKCIEWAVSYPPPKGERVRVWNQTTEQLNILEVAKLVSRVTGGEIRLYENPRLEDAENKLQAKMDGILSSGLDPIKLGEVEVGEIYDLACKYTDRIEVDKIYCTSTWREGMVVDREGVQYRGEGKVATGG